MSVSLWFKQCSFEGMNGYGQYVPNGYFILFSKAGDGQSANPGLWCATSTDANSLLQVSFSNINGYYWNLNFNGSSTLNCFDKCEWVHCVIVIDKNIWKMYLNAKLANQKTINPADFTNANTQDLYFGRMWGGWTIWYPYNGVLDDINIYNCALSQARIDSLFGNYKDPLSGNNLINIDTVKIANPTCTSSNSGSISVFANSKNGPYQYSIDKGLTFQPSNTFYNLSPGKYTIKVRSPCTTRDTIVTLTTSSSVVPSISISASANDICRGTAVTFTATPTSGGTSPLYRWRVNNSNVESNGPTYTTSTLTNGDLVSCIMTSNEACAYPLSDTSNSIIMNVKTCQATACQGTIAPWPSSLQNGLVAYYPFNGNANDESGNGNNPTAVFGPTLTMDRYGNPNAAYHFNGNQYIRGNCSNFPTTTRTVSFWYNGNDMGLNKNGKCVFGYGGGNCGNSWITIFDIPNLSISGHCRNFIAFANSPSPVNNYWHNIIIKYDGSFLNMYLDGCLVTSENKGIITPTDILNKSFFIGTIPDRNGILSYVDVGFQWWVGDLEDVAIWNRALTDQEIKIVGQLPCQPQITISKSSGDTICKNAPVTFTATVSNSAIPLKYQWKLNGVDVGNNSPIYSNSALINGDVVNCILLNSSGCALDTSNRITIMVYGNEPISINIMSDDADNTICSGSSLTFTATVTNGTSLLYQWKVNDVNVGSNTPIYNTATLANNNVVSCVITSNVACVLPATDTSNRISIIVVAPLVPSIKITTSQNNICAGKQATFTAASVHGGPTPGYQWTVNGIKVASGGPTYINNLLMPGDVISCILISSENCVTSRTAYSNEITIKSCPESFYVPNAFTPNNDSKNDVFKPILSGKVVVYKFSIYNRWGEKVFETADLNKGWDGSYRSLINTTNTFVWICKYQFEGHPVILKKGTVTLLK